MLFSRKKPEARQELYSPHGILVPDLKNTRDASFYIRYKARAEIALDACTQWRGGDYFEFGSDALGTFRNFLSAFHINGLIDEFPNTKFWAFDIFGDLDASKVRDAADLSYFQEWIGDDKFEQAQNYIKQHGLFTDRCRLVRGLFADTLTPQIKAETDGIGLAFLDCNILSSYVTCLEFVRDLMVPFSFIYLDEYYATIGVPELFEDFSRYLLTERGLQTIYMRNAGGYGAMFRIMPAATQ